MDESLKILISAQLDTSAKSVKNINDQILELEKKINKINLKIDLGSDILKSLTDFNKNINQIIQSSQLQNSVIKNTTDQINKETQAINQQANAVENLRKVVTRMNGSEIPTGRSTTTGDKYNSITKNEVLNPDQTIKTTSYTQVYNPEKLLADQEKLANQIADGRIKAQEKWAKQQEAQRQKEIDDAHKEANELNNLANQMADFRIQSQIRVQNFERTWNENQQKAIQQNAEIERQEIAKTQAERQKYIDWWTKASHQIDQTEKQQAIDEEKTHALALLQNQARDNDYYRQKELLIAKIQDAQRRYAGDKNVGNLSGVLASAQEITAVGNYKKAISDADLELKKITATMSTAKSNSISFSEAMNTAVTRIFQWGVATTAVYGSLRQLKEGIAYVADLDNALNQIRIVTGKTQEQVQQLAVSYNLTAKEMSVSTGEISNQAADLYRQGLNDQQVKDRLDAIVKYAKTSSISLEDSNKIITASMNGTKASAKDLIDVFSYLGDSTSAGADEIGRAFQKTASLASIAGLDYKKLASYIATVSSVTRDSAETIGNSFKSLLSRYQSIKETGFNSEDATNINQVTKALKDISEQTGTTINAIDKQTGQLRNYGDVLDDISKVWDKLNPKQKEYLQTVLAGTYQADKFAALMNNYNDAIKNYTNSLNVAGTVDQKFQTYQESAAASLDRLRSSWEGFWQKSLDSSTIKNVLSLLTSFVSDLGDMETVVLVLSGVLLTFRARAIGSFITGIGDTVKALVTFKTAAEEGTIAMTAFQRSLGIIGLLVTAGTVLYTVFNNVDDSAKKLSKQIDDNNQKYQDEANLINQVTSYYNANHDAVNTNMDVKSQLFTLQNQLIGTFGEEANGIDLVNGKYEDQIQKIKKLSDAKLGSQIKDQQFIVDSINAKRYSAPNFSAGNGLDTWFGIGKRTYSIADGGGLGNLDVTQYYNQLLDLQNRLENRDTSVFAGPNLIPKTPDDWTTALNTIQNKIKEVKQDYDQVQVLDKLNQEKANRGLDEGLGVYGPNLPSGSSSEPPYTPPDTSKQTQATLHTPTDFTKEEIDAINTLISARDRNIASLQKQIQVADKQKDYNNSIKLTNELLTQQEGKINDINTANSKISASADDVRNRYKSIGEQFAQDGVLFEKWFNGSNASQDYINTIQSIEKSISAIEGDGKNLTQSQQDQIKALDNQKSLYENIFKQIQSYKQAWDANYNSIQTVSDAVDQLSSNLDSYYQTLIDNAQKASDAVDKINSEILTTQGDMRTQVSSIADSVIQIYKDYYKAQQTGIDNTIKKYQDLYDAQIKSIDATYNADQYKQKLSKLQDEQLGIQKQLNVALLNNDALNKKKREDLQKQLADKTSEIQDLVAQHDIDTRKQTLQDSLDTQKKELDSQKDKYQQLIDDDSKYNQIRQQIMSGTFDAVLKDFSGFKDELTKSSDTIGQGLSTGIIEKINNMQTTLQQASSIMGNLFATLGVDIENNVIVKLSQLKAKLDELNAQKMDGLKSELSATAQLLNQINVLSASWANLSATGQASAHDQVAQMRAQLDKEFGTNSVYDKGSGIWNVYKNGQLIGSTTNDQTTSSLNSFYSNQSNLGNAPAPSVGNTATNTMSHTPSNAFDPYYDKYWSEFQNRSDKSIVSFGDWLRAKGYMYHDGGVVGGGNDPKAQALHRMFNLNDSEQMAKLLKGEVVINPNKFNISNVIGNLMSNLSFPKLNNNQSSSTQNPINMTLNFNGFSGTKKDAEFVWEEILGGFNRLGVKLT